MITEIAINVQIVYSGKCDNNIQDCNTSYNIYCWFYGKRFGDHPFVIVVVVSARKIHFVCV